MLATLTFEVVGLARAIRAGQKRFMRDRNKPFVVYRRGWASFSIWPRGIRGWAQFAVWLAMLVPGIAWFAEHVDSRLSGSDYGAGIVVFCMGVVIWLVGGLWWMLARAETVDVVELRRQKQYERRERKRALQKERDDKRERKRRG